MKALRVENGTPECVNIPEPDSDGVRVRVASSSICGSDVHMLALGWLNGMVPGHEFAGVTEDGTLVAVEPMLACGRCASCRQGYDHHCDSTRYVGSTVPGGMAEYVNMPERALAPMPSGMPAGIACLVEPLAVAAHSVDRVRLRPTERVLVIGGGSIGLMTVAALRARGARCDIAARYEHQRAAAERLGARAIAQDGYDVVIDAVGNSDSLAEAVERLRPMGRIGVSGTFWDEVRVNMALCLKEAELVPALGYVCGPRPGRTFDEAGRVLSERPEIAEALITHRFPLEAAGEAFAVAADRAAGAVKVVFEP